MTKPTYKVTVTVEVRDVESDTPEEAIAWVREKIDNAFRPYASSPYWLFYNTQAEEEL